MPANIKSKGVDLDDIFTAQQTSSLPNATNIISNGTDLSQEYMPITDSTVINPGSQIQSTGVLTSTVPYPTDSEYGLVQVLLPMNGSNGSTTFTDLSKNNLTSTSTGVTLTTTDYRFGGSCATFGSFLDTNYIDLGLVEDLEPFWYFGPQSWCVEFWVKDTRSLNSGSVDFHSVFTIGIQSGINYSGLTLGYSRSLSGSTIWPEWWTDNQNTDVGIVYDTPPSYNEWTHFAFTSTYSDTLGAQYRVYVNGKNPIKDGPLNYNYFGGSYSAPPKDRKVCIGRQAPGTGFTPGLIDDLRITIGSPRYTGNFTPPSFPCQSSSYNYNNASVISSLIVNFEGTNGSTNFIDTSYSPKTLTSNAGAAISTDQYKFGVSSGYFSGSSYVSFPANQDFSFGTEDFTIESWVYPVGSSISNPIRIFRMNSGTLNDYTFEVGPSNQLVFFGASSGTTVSWSASINLNAWNHVAWSRYNGVLYAFLNGQKLTVASGSPTNTVNIQNTEFNSFPAGVQGFNLYPSGECYIDNLVITKRVAKYITSFTLPQLPSSFGPNDVSALFATKLNMTGIATPPNTSVSQTGWTVPSGGIVWTHTITATFNSNADLVSFFNAGGEIYIYPSYNPKGVGVDELLYTLLDRVTRITIGGDYTNRVYLWGTLLQPNIGGANVGTATTQLFSYSYSTDGSGLNSTYSVSLAANAAPGSSTVLTITTTLSLPRVSVFTYSNTYSSLIKYRYSTLAPQPTFVGTLSSNISTPIANFTSNVTSGSAALTVNFTDTSTGNPTSWAWDFTNDGSTDSTLQNPSFTYTSAGTYTVKLTATNSAGSNTITKINYITVISAPVANFTSNVTSGQAPLTVNFTDTSSGSPTSWAWDFTNDGSTDSTLQNPSYTYSTPGTYTVKLTTTNAAGSNTITKIDYITVSAAPVNVTANFTSDVTSGLNPLTVNFTDTSTGSPTNWLWDFTNGTIIDNSDTPKTISRYGSVEVSATEIKYGTGSLAFSAPSGYLQIPYSSDLSFESTDWTIEGWIYRVNNSETYSTILDFRGNAAYNTSWGPYIDNSNRTFNIYDGTIFSTPISTPINSVPDFNNWFHYAIVRSGTTTTIYINGVSQASATWNAPPTNSSGVRIGINQATQGPFTGYMDEARFTKGVARYTTNFTPPTQAFPDNSSGDPYYANVSLLLHFDSISTTQNPTFVYSNPGTYSVKLTASKSGSSDTITKTNYITVSTSGLMQLTYNTANAGVLGNLVILPIDVAQPFEVNINWGDGTSSSGKSSSYVLNFNRHTYANPGIYQVTITGKITKFGFNFDDYNDLLVSVDYWDDNLGITDASGAFQAAKNLFIVPNFLPTTVTNTSAMFFGCTVFNSANVTLWNMTNVTNTLSMFGNAIAFNQPIGTWNTSNITNMSLMFGITSGQPNTVFNQPIGNWDTSSVTDMSSMFNGNTQFNQPIGNWDTSNVSNFTAMFANTSAFNQDISDWDVSSSFYGGSASYGPSTGLDMMFLNATAFNQDLSGWCVTNITQKPYRFDENTPAWNKTGRLPVWGTCPP